MSRTQNLGIVAVTVVACIFLFGAYKNSSTTFGMAQSPSPSSTRPQVYLKLAKINKASEGGKPNVQLEATVENTSDSPITILRYNSVLDPSAHLLGTVQLINRQTTKALDIPTIMINRQMPPPDEDYVQVEPHAKVSNLITLPIELEGAVGYEAVAQGNWMELYSRGRKGDPAQVVPYQSERIHFTA